MFYAKICPSKNPCPMGRTLVRDVATPGWGFLVLMEAQDFHYLVPIYIYIYIYIYNIRSTQWKKNIIDIMKILIHSCIPIIMTSSIVLCLFPINTTTTTGLSPWYAHMW
jgi:hypothetical protein